MDINDEFSYNAACGELIALDALRLLLDQATRQLQHPRLSLVGLDVPGLEDTFDQVTAAIDEREDALAVYREANVLEVAHNRGLIWPR